MSDSQTNVKDKAVTVEDLTEALKRTGKAIPAVNASDSGKVLTVNSSGQWVAQSLPTYNGTVVTNNG